MLLTHRIQEYRIIKFPDGLGIRPEQVNSDKLIIEGEEYSEQARTLSFHNSRTNEKTKRFIKFPMTHFCKYSFGDYYFYSLTGWQNGKPIYLHLPDVSNIMGMVGLGEHTGGNYVTNINLELDEFINLFWFSSFNSKAIEMFNLNNIIEHGNALVLKLPHLWSKEIPFGFELWQKE